MAVEIAAAYVSLTVSAKGIEGEVGKQLGGVEKQAAQSGDRAGKGLAGGFSRGMKSLAGAAAGLFAFDKVTTFFSEANEEAKESAKVNALTANVIKTTGAAAGVTANQVADLASSLSDKTAVDDEQIQSGANLLLTFTNVRNEVGKGNDIFNQGVGLANDMSAALGQSMKSSAMQLGKALNDPVKGMTALSRVGVSFTADQKKQVEALVKSGDTLSAQKIILTELKKEFGGSAEAIATPAAKAQVAWDNFKETIGTALLPVIEHLANFATTVLLPGIMAVGRVLGEFGQWIYANREPLLIVAAIIGTILLPALLKMAATAVLTKVRTVAAWAVMKVKAIASMAAQSVAMVRQIAQWLRMGAVAMAQGARIALAWTLGYGGALLGAVARMVVSAARFIARWIAMAATAGAQALRIAAAWTLSTGAAMAKAMGSMVAASVKFIARWVAMGARSLVAGAQIAKAWFLAMGPVGRIITIVVGVVAAIAANWDRIKAVFRRGAEFIGRIVGKIGDFLGSIWDGAVAGVKGAVNWIIDGINWLIGGVNDFINWYNRQDYLPGTLGTIGTIPHLAKGGVVEQATLAVIGEAGPEAVVPLDKLNTMGGGRDVVVTINAAGLDRSLVQWLQKAVRVQGGGNVQLAFGAR